MVGIPNKNFKTALLKVFKELKKDVEKVKKMMWEQNSNINKDTENLIRNKQKFCLIPYTRINSK